MNSTAEITISTILTQQDQFLAWNQPDITDLLFSTFQAALKKSRELEQKEKELKEAREMIKQLRKIIHACAHCKKIRDEEDYWQEAEYPFEKKSDADYSHTVCPECVEQFYPEFKRKLLSA
jgi:hypothetical protein